MAASAATAASNQRRSSRKWAAVGAFLVTSVAAAQFPRNSWKLKPFAPEPPLTHSLADAHLSATEREQIYRAIDNQGIHDSFTAQQRDEERAIVMSSRVGTIVLARNGSDQIFVEGPPQFCGARTQCFRIFVRDGDQLHLVFDSSATVFFLHTSLHNGFHDIGTATIWNSEET
jgi:hypothetical protein